MRILGVTIPEKKQIVFALTVLYGVGKSRAANVLKELKIAEDSIVSDLTADQENLLRKKIEEFTLEGDLRRGIEMNIKRLKDIESNRGYRHARGLPVHGQRTKTNSRTKRGNKRMTAGSGKKKLQKT